MLSYEIIHRFGAIVRHVLGVLLLCWRRMIRTALITWGIGFLLVEIVGAITARQFPAPVLTHVVALIFAFSLAYGALVTVLVDELAIGALDTIKLIGGEVEAGARSATVIAEHELGLLPWLGLARKRSASSPAQSTAQPATPAPAKPLSAQPAAAKPEQSAAVAVLSADEQRAQTQADIEATDAFSETAPRPRVNARPVRADQLPRISWAVEQLEQQERQEQQETQSAATTAAVTTPESESSAAPATVPLADTTDTSANMTENGAENEREAARRADAAAPDKTDEVAEQDEPLPFVIAPHVVPRAQIYSAAPSSSSEGAPADETEPDDEHDHSSPQNGMAGYRSSVSAPATPTNAANGQRGIWSRISKTLVGNVHPPITTPMAPITTPLDSTFEDEAPLNGEN